MASGFPGLRVQKGTKSWHSQKISQIPIQLRAAATARSNSSTHNERHRHNLRVRRMLRAKAQGPIRRQPAEPQVESAVPRCISSNNPIADQPPSSASPAAAEVATPSASERCGDGDGGNDVERTVAHQRRRRRKRRRGDAADARRTAPARLGAEGGETPLSKYIIWKVLCDSVPRKSLG